MTSLARLWPLLRHEGPWPRLLYHGLDSPSVLFAKPWVAALLGAFRLTPGDLAWFSEPVRIGRVIVPGPSFEEDHRAHRVHAKVGQAIAAALPAGSPPAGEMVYFSKARLASGVWRILTEGELDGFLLDRGVTVLYPNRMPLEAQIAALNHASCAISTSNSALHTLLPGSAQAARPGPPPPSPGHQPGADRHPLRCRRRPSPDRRASHRGAGRRGRGSPTAAGHGPGVPSVVSPAGPGGSGNGNLTPGGAIPSHARVGSRVDSR